MVKRPSYRNAVAWIAANDSPSDPLDADLVHSYLTVGFVADLFGVDQKKVAADVVKAREKAARDR